MSNTVDLGNGHRIEFTRDNLGANAGLIHYHPRPDGQGECAGAITFRGRGSGQPEWDLVSLEPLTATPSLLCGICGSHGFIRDGKWVDV